MVNFMILISNRNNMDLEGRMNMFNSEIKNKGINLYRNLNKIYIIMFQKLGKKSII